MNIIILGAGQVGSTLAENLVSEENDVTVVDLEPDQLRSLNTRLDIRTIEGAASHPTVLREAGADDADMIIAVTSSDETNMVACQVAYTLFHTPTKIARIRSPRYLAYKELFNNEAIPIDVSICPEQIITNTIRKIIDYPGALQVLDFAHGKAQLVVVKPYYGGTLVGKPLSALHDHIPGVDMRIAAIYRSNRSLPLTGDTTIEIGDEVFFIAASIHVKQIMAAMRRKDHPNKRIMIAGGGHIGRRLAGAIESRYQVKIVDHNPRRTKRLAEDLDNSVVLLGEACDRELLIDENIEHTDVFCSLTNDDEANIMSGLLAKRLGARQALALCTRTAYVDLIEGSDIDVAISPQQASIGSILTCIRRGDIVNVHSLRRGAAEAIEVIAHGDKKTSKVVGKKIDDIKLPTGITIGAVVRDNDVLIAHHNVTIEADDHVILFLVEKKHIHDVERLFQVEVTYI